jgi:hypothetical protein
MVQTALKTKLLKTQQKRISTVNSDRHKITFHNKTTIQKQSREFVRNG